MYPRKAKLVNTYQYLVENDFNDAEITNMFKDKKEAADIIKIAQFDMKLKEIEGTKSDTLKSKNETICGIIYSRDNTIIKHLRKNNLLTYDIINLLDNKYDNIIYLYNIGVIDSFDIVSLINCNMNDINLIEKLTDIVQFNKTKLVQLTVDEIIKFDSADLFNKYEQYFIVNTTRVIMGICTYNKYKLLKYFIDNNKYVQDILNVCNLHNTKYIIEEYGIDWYLENNSKDITLYNIKIIDLLHKKGKLQLNSINIKTLLGCEQKIEWLFDNVRELITPDVISQMVYNTILHHRFDILEYLQKIHIDIFTIDLCDNCSKLCSTQKYIDKFNEIKESLV